MKLNQQLIQINKNFLICFLVSATFSAGIAQILSDYESHINATITITLGYVVYFGIFFCLFYFDNKKRYSKMSTKLIKKELIAIFSSFGIGEIGYLAVRWPTFYYFLESGIESFLASIVSEIIATGFYMLIITVFLRGTKTF